VVRAIIRRRWSALPPLPQKKACNLIRYWLHFPCDQEIQTQRIKKII
jgi:hypothetical protein